MISVNDAHKIADLLPGISNANLWREAKRQCSALPELRTCYRWKNNSEVLDLLASAEHPVHLVSKTDLWNRLYTVSMTSGDKVVKYSY